MDLARRPVRDGRRRQPAFECLALAWLLSFLLKLRGMIMVRACGAMPDGLRRRALLVVALVAVFGAPTLAPHDGTYIGMISEGLPSLQAVGMAGVQFDAAKFNWLGAIAPIDETVAVWHTAGITTFDGARQRDIVTGATARGSITYTFPALLNELFGSRFKLVTGYNGGTEINLAMERGEVEARNNTWSSWKATKPAWLSEHKISIILQSGPRPADLDVPLVADLAGSPDDRRLIDLVLSGGALGRPLATTPDVPPERVAALRAAFDETMKDAEFLAEAKALHFDVDPIRGVDLQTTVERILSAPPDVTRRAKHLLE